MPATILIRGAGDLASGIALRLHRVGLNIVMTELPQPLAVRRTVSFAEAIYARQATVEEVIGRRVERPHDPAEVLDILSTREIPVLVDPECRACVRLQPLAVVDARMMKQRPEPHQRSKWMYIGLGPGFHAPDNCDAAIETQRGHSMGRVILRGSPRQDTAVPEGDARRILRAPADGVLESGSIIGQHFETGDLVATVGGVAIAAPFSGTLRGLLHPGVPARKGMKVGDIDTRDDANLCRLVSDKCLAVGGGVLEALLAQPDVRTRLWE